MLLPSVGSIAPTRVVDVGDPELRDKVLRKLAVEEVWGVDRRLEVKLEAMRIQTTWDLAQYDA